MLDPSNLSEDCLGQILTSLSQIDATYELINSSTIAEKILASYLRYPNTNFKIAATRMLVKIGSKENLSFCLQALSTITTENKMSEVYTLVFEICNDDSKLQADAFKMGLTEKIAETLENNSKPDAKLIRALASLSSQYEPARELIILKLKNVLMIKLTEQESSFELFHSLSRGSKVLKNILIEESLVVLKLKQKMATSEVAMKVIANLSIDRKVFMDVLPSIKQLSI